MNLIEFGDCRETMRRWKEQGIKAQTCVTSPPYYGLRDYGTAKWDGGDEKCEHTINHYSDTLKPDVERPFRGDKSACIKCGAKRIDSQIGLEPTPEAYVAKMVEVFREVRRVLRDDGTVWLNLGDSYNGYKGNAVSTTMGSKYAGFRTQPARESGYGLESKTLKPKDLIGIPWMVAFALRADGWYLRQDIIWHKPNPMPESVTDRPTKSHEYIFLLTKSARYFYDAEAIREESSESSKTREKYNGAASSPNPKNVAAAAAGVVCGTKSMAKAYGQGRNKRSVWTVSTKPYSEAHFATFPTDLITPCILAGCPDKTCAECGAPWERVVQKPDMDDRPRRAETSKGIQNSEWQGATSAGQKYQEWRNANPDITLGFAPTCTCNAGTVPGTVLDPFMGSGTTAEVAMELGCHALGIELNPEYCELIRKRLNPILEQELLFK